MFQRSRLVYRLALLVTVAIVGLLALGGSSLWWMRSNLDQAELRRIKDIVDSTTAVLDFFHAEESAGRLSRTEAQKAALTLLRKTRFEQDKNYLFINGPDGAVLLSPMRPETEGVIMLGQKTSDGVPIWDQFGEIIRTDTARLVTYKWPRRPGAAPEQKYSWVRPYQPWGWAVGAGIYLTAVDEVYGTGMKWTLAFGLFLLALISGLSWLLVRNVLRQLGGEPQEAVEAMQRVADGDMTVVDDSAPPGSLLHALGVTLGSLRSILNAWKVAIVGIDAQGRIVDWNLRAEAVFGYRREAVLGRQADAQMLAETCRDRLRQGMQRFLDSGDEALMNRPVEMTAVHSDGREFPIEIVITPRKNRQTGHFTAFVTDITERRNVLRSLTEAREAAENANRAKSEFLSSMSHELRTPMNAILGFAQMLEHDANLNEDQKDNVHEILKGGRHLLQLINEVLDLAKIEAGRIDLSIEPLELAELVDNCRDLIQPLAAARQIALHLDVPPQAVVRGDRIRTKQALLNLLSNAVKYNRLGGSIQLSVQFVANQRLRICVSDTGAGIAPEHLNDLFQPFSRLKAEHSEIEGTGIGLTITRNLIELMGGAVGVDSKVGDGSTFWIELPSENNEALDVSTRPTAPASAESAPPSHAAGRTAPHHRVLCIDDNPVNLKLVAQMIALRANIHLFTAHMPGLGIELANTQSPDLILLDINMPNMDGYQVLEILRADPRTAAIPIVAITANAMPRDIERGRAAGFTAYLTKPLVLEQFLATVDDCLASRLKGKSNGAEPP